jgi:nucleotide-binding universal stress UspA family protein
MRVLLFTDGHAGARAATTWLARFAPVEPSALRIVAIAQTPPLPTKFSAALRSLRKLAFDQSRRVCEEARTSLEGRWAELSVEVIEGDPHERLLRAAETWKPELVVLGRSASSESSPSLGSVARLGGYHLECSVLVVDRAPEAVREIVLGMDGSPSAREATRLLSHFSFTPRPRVRTLGIVNSSWRRNFELQDISPAIRRALDETETQEATDARALLARTTAALVERAIVEPEVVVGSPAEVLLETARQGPADVIAVGHQGLEPVRRLTLGSVAAQLLAAAPCSLLIGRK